MYSEDLQSMHTAQDLLPQQPTFEGSASGKGFGSNQKSHDMMTGRARLKSNAPCRKYKP